MGDIIYGMSGDKDKRLCALWRQLGKEIRISAEIHSNDETTEFNGDNILSLEITDDGNIFETYMKKAVLKIQATDETEEALKELVDNADSIYIEYGVYYDGEILGDNGDVIVDEGTTSMFILPTMYVSHEETDTDYDEVTKTATFTCYDAMKLLNDIYLKDIVDGNTVINAPDVLETIKKVVNVSDEVASAFELKRKMLEIVSELFPATVIHSSVKNISKETVRDYLNIVSNLLYKGFVIKTDENYNDCLDFAVLNTIDNSEGNLNITVDDIKSISLGKKESEITGVVKLKTGSVEGDSTGNVVLKMRNYKNGIVDGPSSLSKNVISTNNRFGTERLDFYNSTKGLQLRDYDITTYGMPWLKPLNLVEYTDLKGNTSSLLINSSVLTISNGITQRFYNTQIHSLFEDYSNGEQKTVEKIVADDMVTSNSVTPLENKGCDIGSSDERFNTVYCVDTDTTSDLKNKENIESLIDNDKLLDFFKMMKPCSFTMKDGDTGRKHMGFIAQWCAETAQKTMGDLSFFGASYINENGEREYYRDDVDDSKLSWGLKLGQLIAPLWAVVQIQLEKIEDLKKQVEELKNGN